MPDAGLLIVHEHRTGTPAGSSRAVEHVVARTGHFTPTPAAVCSVQVRRPFGRALHDQAVGTVEANLRVVFAADLRDSGMGARILHHLGVGRLKLLTNNRHKIVGLSGFDRELAERVPLHPGKKPHDERSMWCAHGRRGSRYDEINA